METIKLDDEDFGEFNDLMEEYENLIEEFKEKNQDIAIQIDETLNEKKASQDCFAFFYAYRVVFQRPCKLQYS